MLDNLVLGKEGLKLDIKGAGEADFSFIWLRDNARDEASFDSQNHQRELYTAALPPAIRPLNARISDDGSALVLDWHDVDLEVRYDAAYLAAYCKPDYRTALPQPTTWDADSLKEDDVTMAYSDLKNEAGITDMLGRVARYGFAFVKGAPRSTNPVRHVAESIGYVRRTIFGEVFEFESNANMADSAYSSKELRPHTDGTYSHDAPGIQILLSLNYKSSGGASILVDGAHINKLFRKSSPEIYADMTRIDVTGIYKGDGVVLRASRPMLRCDKQGQLVQVSFNNYDRDTVRLENDEMRRLYECIRRFDARINDPANQWRHILKPGEMLVFDNWRVLHGRGSFTGMRRMAGAYVNREDFESKLRLLSIV